MITDEERLSLDSMVKTKTAISCFEGFSSGSCKESDFMIMPEKGKPPTVVIESGWIKSQRRLQEDINVCFFGGNGAVEAALYLIWRKAYPRNEIAGEAQPYAQDQNGMPVLRQSYTIFPAPSERLAHTQFIE
ncbi:hypothetical protein BBP40_001875 [Aspergillus hancockii]|nr:hypothetical protein BBP40_001875 [Aspergillus hancockii]